VWIFLIVGVVRIMLSILASAVLFLAAAVNQAIMRVPVKTIGHGVIGSQRALPRLLPLSTISPDKQQ
jgi:Na+-transporting methylmalonyl-CoA/oxaloacetate decarboxylase gamma subunit